MVIQQALFLKDTILTPRFLKKIIVIFTENNGIFIHVIVLNSETRVAEMRSVREEKNFIETLKIS